MTTTIPFIAYEISGLAFPTTTGYYNSGAVNYKFVNAISGGLKAQITAGAGVQTSAFQTLTASTGITPFANTVKVSSQAAQTLSVLGYSTISGNAKWSQTWLNASGAQFANLLRSGAQYTNATRSGNKYTSAYKSAQALKVHAFHAKISSAYLTRDSGWATITSGTKLVSYTWTFPKNPRVAVQPSGTIAFATSVYNITTTNFTASITAAGNRVISWEAYI